MKLRRSFHGYAPNFVGLALHLGLALPTSTRALEASLSGHMLVQIPLLAASGWLMGQNLYTLRGSGVPALLVAVFAALFWMIPRWLDAALSDPTWELIKFIAVPFLIGLPLGLSWPRLSSLAKGFVWANGISMLAVLGWLYLAAPVRVCNNYLIGQQEEFGLTALFAAAAIALYWIGIGFFGDWRRRDGER